MGRKVIVQLWLEVHVPDTETAPDQMEAKILELFSSEAAEHGGLMLVVRSNSFLEPLPDVELPPIPEEPDPRVLDSAAEQVSE